MALTVSYECDKALRLIELLADNLYDFKVCLLIMSTYIVNLSYTFSPVPYTGSGLSLSAFAIISGISFSGKWYGP